MRHAHEASGNSHNVIGNLNPGHLILTVLPVSTEEAPVNSGDVNVAIATVAAVTHDWWSNLVTWVPSALQMLVFASTVVYVVFRAANEVRKFYGKRS